MERSWLVDKDGVSIGQKSLYKQIVIKPQGDGKTATRLFSDSNNK